MFLGALPGLSVCDWASCIKLQSSRVEDSWQRYVDVFQLYATGGAAGRTDDEQRADLEARALYYMDVYFLVLAIRSVVRIHEAIASRLADSRLQSAGTAFSRSVPTAKAFRDLYEHIDEYAVGRGRLQRSRVHKDMFPFPHSVSLEGLVVSYGDMRLDLATAAQAAIDLADKTCQAWVDAVNSSARRKSR